MKTLAVIDDATGDVVKTVVVENDWDVAPEGDKNHWVVPTGHTVRDDGGEIGFRWNGSRYVDMRPPEPARPPEPQRVTLEDKLIKAGVVTTDVLVQAEADIRAGR